MSQSAPPKGSGSIDPIRQQLDELDALLQRMLSLPESAPEPEAVPSEPVLGRVAVVEELPPLPPPLPPPRTIMAPLPTYHDPATIEVPPPSLPLRSITPHPPLSETLPPFRRPSAWVSPLIWVNRGFDTAIGPLGFLGRWLRQPFGRAFLGWLGVLCLAAAVILVLLDWLGWTRLPGLLQ